MRLVDRILWLCLSLVLNACSLVTDFPEPLDGGLVTGKTGDGGVSKADAGRETGACTAEQAPFSGSKGCECEPGEGPCSSGAVCDPDQRKCVPCFNNLHCAGKTNGFDVCVANNCVDCARNNPADPSDDEGCTDTKKPVCTAEGTCVGCTPGGTDCPSGQTCVAGNGCFGCDPQPGFPANNCKSTTPACLPADDGSSFQCKGCTDNSQCSDAYCDENRGTCHNGCDPHPASDVAGNGCQANAPICRAGADGEYSCQPCVAGDMCPTGQACSTVAPTVGQCVPAAAACPAPLMLVGGRCVCTANAQCMGNPAGPLCNVTTGACGPCVPGMAGDAACVAANMATPYCSTAGTCVACKTNAECGTTPRTPICSPAGTCVACTTDASCAAANRTTPICMTTGDFAGACGVCNPGAALTESTCTLGRDRGYCYSVRNNAAPVCNQCFRDSGPSGGIVGCPGGTFATCTLDPADSHFKCGIDVLNPITGN